MKPFRFSAMSIAAVCFVSFDVSAAIDPAASVVLLRTSCNDGSSGTLNNCFTNTDDLVQWINNIRLPKTSATAPLLVQVGPGKFTTFHCASAYITLQGAGSDATSLEGDIGILTSPGACKNLTVTDMTVTGVYWVSGTGDSIWNNVIVREAPGANFAWYDLGGNHFWHNSQIISKGKSTAYEVNRQAAGSSWFFGSRVVAISGSGGTAAFMMNGNELHMYGSNISVEVPSNISLAAGANLVALKSSNNAQAHFHGTGIDVLNFSMTPASITVFHASSGAMVHANASSYFLRTAPGGLVTRINNNNGSGHVHAPYLWEHVPDTDGNPATIDTNFVSANGADQTTVTVGTSDGHPHPAIYSATCPANMRWYDTVDKICRNQ